MAENSITINELNKATAGTATDLVLITKGTTGYKMAFSDFAKYVVETYETAIVNQNQSVVNALDELYKTITGPKVASTVSAMTDTSKIYVYTGSETGYVNGNWYYHNGSAWVSGGVYNSVAVQTDTTLSISGQAADGKAVGDALDDAIATEQAARVSDINDLNARIDRIKEEVTGQLDITSLRLGGLRTDGTIYDSSVRATFAAFAISPVPVKIHFDSPYRGTICTYENDKSTLISRTNVSTGGVSSAPANIYFRVCVFHESETAITDLNVVAQKVHTVIEQHGATIPLTESDDLNNLKTTGIYMAVTSTLPAHWPISYDRPSGSYGFLYVEKADNMSYCSQTVIDYRQNFYIRRYESSGGWTSWVQYAKRDEIIGLQSDISDVNDSIDRQIAEVNGSITQLQTNVIAPMDSVLDDLRGANYYLNSEIVSGNLNGSGELSPYSSRATFSEYLKMPYECQLKFDANYRGGLCLYDNQLGFISRTSISTGSFATIPADTFFRVTIFDGTEKTITDVSAYAKKVRLIINWPVPVKEVSSSGDLNDVKDGGSYFVSASAAHVPISHDRTSGLYGILGVYPTTGTGVYQSYMDYRQNFFMRRYDSGGWTSWVQSAKYSDVSSAVSTINSSISSINTAIEKLTPTKPLAAKIFKRVGCIGDSYTEGYINIDGVVTHSLDYSWPHYMEALTGNTWTNFGVGGSSSKSWVLNNDRYSKLTEVQAAGNKCQAYVIGLMINDRSPTQPTRVSLGTASDIGTDADSYYAYYYKLIIAVHNVNPDAPIFCNTCPKDDSSYTGYNQAVRDIVTYCQNNALPVYLCDLAGSKYNTPDFYQHPIFTTDSLNGHYSGIGYEMMAECYLKVISDIVTSNVTSFQKVHLIPYDAPE